MRTPRTIRRGSGSYHHASNICIPILIGSRYLIDRLDQTYNSFPHFIRWNVGLLHSDTDDKDFFTRLTLRLGMLEYKLLLERLAYKQGMSNGQTMADCAREMLELVVLVWVQRDRFIEHHSDYDVRISSDQILCNIKHHTRLQSICNPYRTILMRCYSGWSHVGEFPPPASYPSSF